jgi:hypothetical protein
LKQEVKTAWETKKRNKARAIQVAGARAAYARPRVCSARTGFGAWSGRAVSFEGARDVPLPLRTSGAVHFFHSDLPHCFRSRCQSIQSRPCAPPKSHGVRAWPSDTRVLLAAEGIPRRVIFGSAEAEEAPRVAHAAST